VATTEPRREGVRAALATAVAGQAQVLVTGDHGLLATADTAPLVILLPRAVVELLRQVLGGQGHP